jgi:predicted amidohydrolase
MKFCREHGCWIQTGTFLETDPAFGKDVLFNTTVLVGPGGIESIYRKVNPWIPWELQSSPHDFDPGGDHFPVADTEIGRIGAAICYDWLFPEAIRQLAMNGAEIINRVSAYMDPWGATAPMDWWTLVNRTRALENTAYVVAANQGASMEHFPPFSWPGASMIIDYDGRILSQAEPGPGERVVIAPIALDTLRYERDRRFGHDMRSHLRSEAYSYLRTQHLPPAAVHPLEVETTRERIADARGVEAGKGLS